MSVFGSGVTRVRLIAGNTFLEAVRQRFFLALFGVAVVMVASGRFFQQFDFGTSELGFIVDFGFGAIYFFGAILAVVMTTQVFFGEIENRTALTVLSKPIHKVEFLAGKYLGAQFSLLVFAGVLAALLALLLFWRESALMARFEEAFAGGRIVRYGDVFLHAFLQWLKFGMLGAITLFISTFARSQLSTVMLSVLALLICQLQHIARAAYADLESLPLRLLVTLFGAMFPDFSMYDLGDQLVLERSGVGAGDVLSLVLYALVYVGAYIGLAQLSFRERVL